MRDATELWSEFVKAFAGELQSTQEADATVLAWHWLSQTARTTLYADRILKQVAIRLGMVLVPERFKVDFAMGVKQGETLVPLVFVESENQAKGAEWEINKLCSLRAPLRVLICCTEWLETPGYWPRGGRRTELVKCWSEIIQAHNRHLPDHGKIGLIVGESGKGGLRFYANAWDDNGQMPEEDDVIFSCTRDAQEAWPAQGR